MARSFPGGAGTDRIIAALTSNNSVRSYSIWTNRNGDGGGNLGRIWHKGNTGAGLDTSFNNNSTDNAYDYNRRFSVSNGIWRFTRPGTGAWHHIFLSHDTTSDANDPIIRLDGVLQSLTEAQVPSGTVANNAEGYCLGNRNDTQNRCWDGLQAEFAVWNRILTDAEAAALAGGCSPLVFPQNLVEYLPLVRDAISRILAPPSVTGTTVADHPRIFRLGAVPSFSFPAAPTVVTPSPAVISFSSFAPTVQKREVLTPAAASLALTSFAPMLRQRVEPPHLTLSLSTFAPTVTGPAATQRNYLVSTTAISLTANGTTITSGNTQSATFVVARTMVRSGLTAGELLSGSQTWKLHYVVSAMATPYEMRLKVQRLNSGGTMQAESGYTTVRTATGTYDDNLTADLGTWAANDQLAVVWEHRRPSGSGNKNGTIDANAASYLDAPITSSSQTVTPAAALLTLTTLAPKLNQTTTPGKRDLSLSTFAPQLRQHITPASRTLAFAPFAPALHERLTPASRDLSLTTFAPSLSQGTAVVPDSRTLTLSPFAPSLQTVLTPNARAVAFASFAPQLRTQTIPASRSVTFTTFEPAVTQSAALVPGSRMLALSTFAPMLQSQLTPGSRSLSFASFAPALWQTVTPDSRTMALQGFAPAVNLGVVPASGSLTFATFAPSLSTTTTPGARSLVLTTFGPQLREQLTPPSRALNLTTFAPVLDNNVSVVPSPALLTFTRLAPFVTNPVTVTAGSATITLSTNAPQLRAQLTPGARDVALVRFAPSLALTATPAGALLNLSAFAPRLETRITVSAGLLALSGFAPTIIGGIVILPPRTLDTSRTALFGGVRPSLTVGNTRRGLTARHDR